MSSGSDNTNKPSTQSLNSLAEQQQQQQHQQTTIFTQPTTTPLKQQNTSSSRFNETHELNDLLTQGTGLDTFGNTGDTRIPHQHTKTQNFINSSGTGYKQTGNEPIRLSSNATGNPFLNTGIGYQGATQQQVPQINPAYTGYGFGNAQPQQHQQYQQQQQQSRNGNDGPSLIDI